jgi:alcohol dehydrogenase
MSLIDATMRLYRLRAPGSLDKLVMLQETVPKLAPEGEIALIGLLDNPMNTISPLPLMARMGVLRGVSVGSRADLAGLLALMQGRFAPKIDRVFEFDQAHQALGHLASRQHVGKVVIRLGHSGG